MISNPATFFVNGSTEKKFIYEGGTILYHFSPYDNGLSKTLGENIVFFADSEVHAVRTLKRLFQFAIDCYKEYLAYCHDNPYCSSYGHRAETDIVEYAEYIKALDEGRAKVTLAPTNQVFKVGWASNDTL